jgi:hypothetical protein
MTFAQRVFGVAGIYGLLVLAPMYFLEQRLGQDHPPAITHPEHYYGFVGLGLAWQALFLVLARDPVRYRPMMIPCFLEKAAYGLAVIALFALGRTDAMILGFAIIDLVLGALFLEAYRRTPSG